MTDLHFCLLIAAVLPPLAALWRRAGGIVCAVLVLGASGFLYFRAGLSLRTYAGRVRCRSSRRISCCFR